ncbi:uncharacterized protein LOC141849008 [Brevipalpus obovatus]|uniref:uncharacterized protein LOC141849008 n=1 Tax=Brevipalpus obovatus TaxID=246614 RepID=UPI003D9E8FEF
MTDLTKQIMYGALVGSSALGLGTLYLLLRGEEEDFEIPKRKDTVLTVNDPDAGPSFKRTLIKKKVLERDLGRIIGTKGENIRRIQKETNTIINIPDKRSRNQQPAQVGGQVRKNGHSQFSNGNGRKNGSYYTPQSLASLVMTIEGAAIDVIRAEEKIDDIIDEYKNQNSERIFVRRQDVGIIIGRQGSTIREIRENTGVCIDVPRDRNSKSNLSEIVLTGTLSQIEKAKWQIDVILKDRGVDPARANILRQTS